MEYRKYKFTPSEWNGLKELIALERSNWSNCSVAILGPEIDTPAVFSTEGDMIVEQTYKSDVRVDIIWYEAPLVEFLPYEVWPADLGQHCFAGMENLYLEAYASRSI